MIDSERLYTCGGGGNIRKGDTTLFEIKDFVWHIYNALITKFKFKLTYNCDISYRL